jgi:transcriptional regulator of acetoin/glycerol metabolism
MRDSAREEHATAVEPSHYALHRSADRAEPRATTLYDEDLTGRDSSNQTVPLMPLATVFKKIVGNAPTVNATIGDEANRIEMEVISHSWRRCAELHHIDPESGEPPRILTESALRLAKEPIACVVRAAHPELDRLHRIVGHAGYVTLLCDTQGVAVEHRGSDARSAEFRHWGIWLGGAWSETVEGTNGIGTCIADRRAVTVHQTQHFRSRHTGLSSSAAPVFDADAQLVAVLDVSSMDPHLSTQAHALTLPLVVNSARQIEERLFRERFSHAWIIAVAPEADHSGALLAVDREHRVIGADRFARRQFALDQRALETGTGVWTIFSRNSAIMRRGVRSDYLVRLTCVRGGETLFALVSSPVADTRVHLGKLDSTLLMQPRIALLEDLRRHYAPDVPRGGLSPGALRRVREYISAHIHEKIDIATLASLAGLSTYHFSRVFKASAGMPPHRYLLEQRIRKAAELIERSEQPLVSIALAAGFADQAHFSRNFHAVVGLTPSQFRRAHR